MKPAESTHSSSQLKPLVTENGNGAKVQSRDQNAEPIVDDQTAIVDDIAVDDRETADENETIDNPEADEQQPTSRKRRTWLLLGGAIVLFVGAVFGWRWWQFQRTHVSTDNAQIQGHLSPISAKVSATVQKVLVQDGDRVHSGQPLIVLENQDLTLQLQQAEADLAKAQAQLQSAVDTVRVTRQTNPTQVQQAQAKLAASQSAVAAAQANVNQAQAKIETNQANVTQARTEVTQTQTDFSRYQTLYQDGVIAAQLLDTARAAYNNAQAKLTAAQRTVAQSEAELHNAQAQLKSAQAEVDAASGQVQETQASGQTITVQQDQRQAAQAQVKQAEAALALAKQQVAYTVIAAPIDGYVGQLTAQVGQKVEVAQPLLSVVPLKVDQVYVEANFKETALGRLQLGDEAEVEVDAYPGERFHATIAGISPATGSSFALIPPDNATGNFNKVVQWVPVRLMFDANADPNHKLRPGLNVTVIVDTASTPGSKP
jgi:membrane fusion protein (multidrug efflux system)